MFFLLLVCIIKNPKTKQKKQPPSSPYSTTILVAAALSQLQGAQILFVAFSSFVYLLFVPTIPTEMGKAVFLLLGFFFFFLNDFDSFCKTQEVGAFWYDHLSNAVISVWQGERCNLELFEARSVSLCLPVFVTLQESHLSVHHIYQFWQSQNIYVYIEFICGRTFFIV